MTRSPDHQIVLAAALSLPDSDGAPEWVHLLPAGGPEIRTFDGRGPYRAHDLGAVIQASMAEPRGVHIDVNHSTDLAAPNGGESPARGWIKEMQLRADGIWGRVEWTGAGKELVADRAYRGISPVLIVDARDRKTILRISHASLVNRPNLRGLAALNQENSVTLAERLAEKLGLKAGATEDEILAAIPQPATALQSAMSEIGTALGVDGGNAVAVVAAARAAKAGTDSVTALQAQVTSLQSELTSIRNVGKRTASEAYVDAEIARKRVGLNAQTRETYVALHMEQPETAKKLIEGMPCLDASGAGAVPPAKDGEVALNAEQRQAARLLGIPEASYLATLKLEQETAQ